MRAELAPLGARPSPEALAQLPYLGAVCSEALRLHPVVPIVPRGAPPVSSVGIPCGLARTSPSRRRSSTCDPDVWPEPLEFLPERFLAQKYTPFEYAPFGGGVRRCIGAAFGAYQMRIVLGTVLAARRFAKSDARAPRRVLMNITMGPGGKVRLRVEG